MEKLRKKVQVINKVKKKNYIKKETTVKNNFYTDNLYSYRITFDDQRPYCRSVF